MVGRFVLPPLSGDAVYSFARDNAVAETANILADIRAVLWLIAGIGMAAIGLRVMKDSPLR